ncbi:MAG: class I SAM-dependent methyltransferase [Polyangiaceae bacterium]|nr:class I SAM-dependent methyltransferase [Myxococcales bacterium]MCB9586207.1 class I SAM-dependent methyltransferase [Polyangiaceae bacterium]MCB9606884.1 class I SAM-dependent methyltransferase [Polyangiaceae bacterium]
MWDQRYADAEYVYGTEPNDFLKETAEVHLPRGGAVLCLAEGEGRNGVYLAGLGFKVTGVDGSSVGLQKAQRLAQQRGVEIATIVSDLADYDLGEQRWDGVVSSWCHTPPELRKQLHAAVVRALKPGGALILESYTPQQLEYKTGGPPNAEWMMTLEGLKQELAGLEFVVGEEKIREVNEGKFHGGTSAVVQVVAKKPS